MRVYLEDVPRAPATLLEREREIETLREGLGRARAGDGTLVLIEGPAGVGKTELTRQARIAAEQAGIARLQARGSELEQPFAFGAVRQLLEPLIGDPSQRADLFAGAAGPAARLFELDERESAHTDHAFEALHSLYWLLVNLADQTPVLLLVDDCQWVDRDSLRFLAYLAQRIEDLSIAMVLAGRPPEAAAGEMATLWAQIASRPMAVAMYPRPLSEFAAISLTRRRLGAQAADVFCRSCYTATGGNPLFLEELLRALEAARVVPSAEAAGEVQAVGPAAVSRFVLHRLAALGAPATALARTVAVLGDNSELTLAAHVAGVGEDAARRAGDELVRADIFVRAERLGFAHPIVRAALYDDLTPGERQALHAAAAQALASEGASAERVTAHLLLTIPAGDQQRVQTLRVAANSAARRGSPQAAAARLRRALLEDPATQERAEILTDLGRHEVAAMDFVGAEEHLREALDAKNAALTTRAEAASWFGRCAIVSGGRSGDAAAETLTALSGELAPLDPERSLQLGTELLTLRQLLPHLRPGVAEQLEQFRNRARGHPGFEAVGRIFQAHGLLLGGGSAEHAADEALAALAVGLPPASEISAGLLALMTLALAERYDVATRLLEAALERARREGHATRQGIILGARAAIALGQGSLADAQVEAETGLLLVEEPHFVVLWLVATAIVVQVERGALETAAELAQAGERLAVSGDQIFGSEYLTARGRLRIAQGDVEAGVADLLWCGEQREAMGTVWPSDWKASAAPALASLGENLRATELAREQLAVARRVGAPGALGMSLRAAALATDDGQRLTLLEEAVAVLKRSAARLELAHALADLGAELNRRNRRREGREAARRAIKLAGECGAAALAESARAELNAGPGRRARAELTGPDALTPAEWRVCRQAVEGRTNREIAEALFVTEKTVERHLGSAYQKLGIRSRFQLSAAIDQSLRADSGDATSLTKTLG